MQIRSFELSDEFLDGIWARVVEKALDKGSISKSVIARYYGKFKRFEVEQRLANGTYEFAPPVKKYVPKDDGGKRAIFILSDEDRINMAFITQIYYEMYSSSMSDRCFAYRTGISVGKTVREVQQRLAGKCVIKIDLSKYFDSVPEDVIIELLDAMSFNDGLTEVLKRFYSDNRIIENGVIVQHFKSLCQGCAFSSILANLILVDVDKSMQECTDYYARYSDDILLIADDVDEPFRRLKEALAKYDLSINEKKFWQGYEEVDFLGCHITPDKITLSKHRRQKIKNHINSIVKKFGNVKDRKVQETVTSRIKEYLLLDEDGYSLFQNILATVDGPEDVRWLNDLARHAIRYAYTGKHNTTKCLRDTSEQKLHDIGWCDLQYLERLYRLDRRAFITACRYVIRLRSSPEDEKKYTDTLNLDELHKLLESYGQANYCFQDKTVKVKGRFYKIIDTNRPMPGQIKLVKDTMNGVIYCDEDIRCLTVADYEEHVRDEERLVDWILTTEKPKQKFIVIGNCSLPGIIFKKG